MSIPRRMRSRYRPSKGRPSYPAGAGEAWRPALQRLHHQGVGVVRAARDGDVPGGPPACTFWRLSGALAGGGRRKRAWCPRGLADSARFWLARGGKDRHLCPAATKVLDETIMVLKSALAKARLGNEERLDAIGRLNPRALQRERQPTGPSLAESATEEMRRSADFGGRSVFGWELLAPRRATLAAGMRILVAYTSTGSVGRADRDGH